MISGGLRARFLNDSLTVVVRDGLSELGWFEASRSHRPLKVLALPVPWNVPVAANTVMVTAQGRTTEEVEVGSWLISDSISVVVDFYAEGDSIGMHVANDVRDVLRGRVTTAALQGSFPIYDYRHATPPVVGRALISDVRAGRLPMRMAEEYTRHWFMVDATVTDTYYFADPGT